MGHHWWGGLPVPFKAAGSASLPGDAPPGGFSPSRRRVFCLSAESTEFASEDGHWKKQCRICLCLLISK